MNLLLWGVFWLLAQQPAASSGINFFSPKQDIEIGTVASAEAEKTLPLLRDANLNRYVRTVGQRLTGNTSIPELQYRFRIVNSKEINSIGFPGGSIYVNRGLLEITSSENELAAILAHEIAHVAGRHGTSQLSRQLLVQAPITIAAGLPTNAGWRDQLAKLGVSFGVRASFLRYNRDQEIEASLTAVRLLHEARFDPKAFETLLQKVNRAENDENVRLPAFVFNHPRVEALHAQLEAEIERLTPVNGHTLVSGDFRAFHGSLSKLPYPAVEESPAPENAANDVIPEQFEHPYYRLGYPKGWQVRRTGVGGPAIIAPAAGTQGSQGGNDITRGVIVDFLDLTDRQLSLEQATDRLIVFLRQPARNQGLRLIPGAQSQTLVSDEPALRTVLVGKPCRPDETCSPEVVWLVTRIYYQSLFYMVLVAPEDEFPAYQPIFEQIIRSARLI